MKTKNKRFGVAILGVALFIGCGKKPPATSRSFDNPEISGQLKNFMTAGEKQARDLAAQEGKNLPLEFNLFFAAAEKGDWQTATNQFEDLRKRIQSRTNTVELRGGWWSATMDAYGALEQFSLGDEKYAAAFGNDIIDSIPPGSIYFGGTDPGRFIVTALSESHADGKPFFTLTQNALADGTYLGYLRSMYGGKIYIPTAEDLQKCFQDYTKDATQRQQNGNLKPGEDVTTTGGRVSVSGQVAVMEINGLLVKTIFDQNPDREFYIEESFPLDWMYPYLEPHDLIMKINRQPLPELSDEIVQRDSDYWTKYMTPMIGDWLKPDTTVEEIAAFAEKVYAKNDLSGFTGDLQFIQDVNAQKMFSKLRSSIAGLYAWRAQHATSDVDKERMQDAADFAFRQAWALCPYLPEAVFQYVNLLVSENRRADALLVAETAAKMPEMKGANGAQVRGLIEQLKQMEQIQTAR